MPDGNIATPVGITRSALRVVLFGIPDAGKSSLLGALAQAAQTQEHLLNGHLTDQSQGLAELQRRLYEERPRETLEEIVPYPTLFEPFAATTGRRQVVLFDCDGRAANELLTRRRGLDDGSLAREILGADAMVLVVDASASPAQVDADFAEFAKFLRVLEEGRGRRSAVGGQPVFLVLSKCDLLAKADDTPAVWMERIEERKRQLNQRFQDFLAGQERSTPGFGRIDLHLWATAVKRPALANSPAKPREPYGVAELFRQVLGEATNFQKREDASGRRLWWTASGAVALVAAMLGLATSFVVTTPTVKPTSLESKVESFKAREGPTASRRLAEPLVPKLSELKELRNDPDFDQLPAEQRDYVNQRLQELQEYRAYKEKLQNEAAPETVQNERELDELRMRLETDLAPPPPYAAEWGQTEAALLRQERLDDLKALREATNRVEEWYRDLKQKGEALWNFSDARGGAPLPWAAWHARLGRLLAEAETPPFAASKRVPGSRTVTYATALRFPRSEDARSDWEKLKQRLESLRDLTTALGLAGPIGDKPPLLDIPAGFTVEQCRSRWEELAKRYPQHEKWIGLPLPDPVAAEVRQEADSSYKKAIAAGQDAILRQLQLVTPDGKETPQRWEELRQWLDGNPPQLAGWRELTTFLARLRNPKAGDPVRALSEFLRQDRFELDMPSLTLAIPDELKVRPIGNLVIVHQSGGNETRLSLTQRGAGQHEAEARLTRYTYVPSGRSTLTYRPGDTLWAELPLNRDAENRERLFRWSGSRSLVYQFDRLHKAPRLLRAEQADRDGTITEGVQLVANPASGIPALPDLLPIVKLAKR
jgi:hypothetical protein